MNITIILSICLLFSLIVNVLVFIYLRRVVPKLLFMSENANDLIEVIYNYREHLSGLYEMEMFYGEPVLEELLKHTKSLSLLLEEYEDIAALTEPLSQIEMEETEENAAEKEKNASIIDNQENVFYAGSRRRDS